MRFLLLLVVPFVFTACSDNPFNTDTDPLKGEPAYIREAKPKDMKPVEERPFVPSDALVITMEPGIANFNENQEGKLQFKGEIKNIDAPIELSIDNLPPGAEFDPVSGIFTWTPSPAYLTGVAFHRADIITVTLRTTTPPIIQTTEQYNLNVYRSVELPEVLPLVNFPATVTERKAVTFSVVVKDIDAADSSVVSGNKIPKLIITPGSRTKDASAFVKMADANPVQDPNDPTLWKFNLVIDLNAEVTNKEKDMEFNIRANSAFGIPSKELLVKFKAVTDVSPVTITMKDQNNRAVLGQLNVFYFSVFSQRGDGTIDVSDIVNGNLRRLNGNTKVTCTDTSSMVSGGLPVSKDCKFEWIPNQLMFGTSVSMKAKNTHFNGVDTTSSEVKNTFSVVAPANPPAFLE